MTQAIVDQGQWLRDVAIQHAGSISELFAIALANDLSITDDIIPASSLIIPNVVDAALVKFLNDNNYVPATGFSPEDEQAIRGGISYMGIIRNFKVTQ
jgi:hypothetical protein